MPTTDELAWASAVEIARLVRSRVVSASEVLGATLARIDRLDPGIGAIVIDLRARRPPPSSPEAPFAGVPFLLKDAGEELAGTPTWIGTQALRAGNVHSTVTTPFAAALEQLGLRIVGRSACPELSSGASTEPAGFPPTRNPWDRTRSAGGSSGGSAAAVAAGLVPLAHGSDATGSLRYPAALCGVVTLKPSRGRIAVQPLAGAPDPASVWTQFALARHAEDLVALFDAVATLAPARPPWRRRAGVLRHDPILDQPVHPATVAAVDAVAAALERRGWAAADEYPPALRPVDPTFWHAFTAAGDSIRATQVRWIERRVGRPCGPGDLTDAVLASAARGRALTDGEVAAAAATAVAFTDLPDWWQTCDLLVCPATIDPAWPLGTPGDVHCGMFCLAFSVSGQPAVVVPSGVFHDGLPIGVQLVGAHDERLLGLALDLQEEIGWTRWRPPGCA